MNILITSAGRRVALIRSFTNTIKDLKLNSKVFITDLEPLMAPASYFADNAFKIGFFSDPNYIDDLFNICKENKISIVIPTIDTELELLSKVKSRFQKNGINIIISEHEIIEKFSNKLLTNSYFQFLGINFPRVFDNESIQYPVFIKPISGSNSNGIYKANNLNEIKPSDLLNSSILISEYIDSDIYDEYTIDIYFDKNSEIKCVVPRIRLKVVGGESNQGITKKNEVINFVLNKFNNIKGVFGCITLQLFVNKTNFKDIIGIEINPRFGGGYPFSYNSGANFPNFILREYLLNETLAYYEDWKDNCINIRFEEEIILND